VTVESSHMQQRHLVDDTEETKKMIEQFTHSVTQMQLHQLELYRQGMEQSLHAQINDFCKHVCLKKYQPQTDKENSCNESFLSDSVGNLDGCRQDDNPTLTCRSQSIQDKPVGLKSQNMSEASTTKATSSTELQEKFCEYSLRTLQHEALVGSGWLPCIVRSTAFQFFSVALILGNALLLGIAASSNTRKELCRLDPNLQSGAFHTYASYDTWQLVFNILFWIEFLLRIVAYRSLFLRGREYRWNIFDSLIVGMSIVEYLVPIEINFFTLRLIRVFRIGRLSKTFNSVPFIRNLDRMIAACMDAIRACLPACSVILLTTYLFGVFILLGVRESLKRQSTPEYPLQGLSTMFGDISAVMLTLFMSVSNGISWQVCYEELRKIGWTYQLFFVAFIVVMELCVLNMVMGIFVDMIQQARRPDHEEVIAQEEKERQKQTRKLIQIFFEADDDGSGTLSVGEFQNRIASKDFRYALAACNIDLENLNTVFELMDVNADSELSIDEFVAGVERLRGSARSVDVWHLREQIAQVRHGVNDIMRAMQASAWTPPRSNLQEAEKGPCTSTENCNMCTI